MKLDLDAIEKEYVNTMASLSLDSCWNTRKHIPSLIARVRELEANFERLHEEYRIDFENASHRIKILERALELACGGECAANNCFSAHGVEHLVKERIQQAEQELGQEK